MNNYPGNYTSANNGSNEDEPRRLTGFSAELYEWLEAVAFALGIVVLLFTFVFRIVSVSGESMEGTLLDLDRVLVWSMFYTPEQDDIIIILPESDVEAENASDAIFLNKPLVKRIVATEGQWITIKDGNVYVAESQEALETAAPFDSGSDAAFDSQTSGGSFLQEAQQLQIPEGCAFVMGDNRSNSTDSRDSRVGFIKYDNILGEVIFRIYPFDDGFGRVE